MPTNTYVALDKVTVGTATPSVTFSSIPQTYTDLVVVCNSGLDTSSQDLSVRINNDSSALYSYTVIAGNGTSAYSARGTGLNKGYLDNTGANTTLTGTWLLNFMNYANTTTFKTYLSRYSDAGKAADVTVGLYRSTSAITSLVIAGTSGNLLAGSTFSLYGIAATSVGAKATGGIITSDDQYYYHTFLSSGTFTPTQSLTCDYLVVAGGGGGGQGYVDGGNAGGGGGAGGLRSTVGATGGGGSLETALSLSATGYTVTIGAGGASNTAGSDSVFSSITSAGGGKGGYNSNNSIAVGNRGGAGGSGGGGGYLLNLGGAGTTNQGYAGGSGQDGGGYGGGGGGAGQVGNTGGQGKGGNGVQTSISGTATYYAGGGSAAYNGQAGGLGGGGNGAVNGGSVGGAATVNTGGGGGGGGGTYSAGGAGGSGIVIVRYAK